MTFEDEMRSVDLIMGFIFSFWVILMVITLLGTFKVGEKCNLIENSKLISFNGINDQDSGFLSKDSTERNTFVFDSGLVIDSYDYPKQIRLNNKYNIFKCKALMTDTYWRIE